MSTVKTPELEFFVSFLETLSFDLVKSTVATLSLDSCEYKEPLPLIKGAPKNIDTVIVLLGSAPLKTPVTFGVIATTVKVFPSALTLLTSLNVSSAAEPVVLKYLTISPVFNPVNNFDPAVTTPPFVILTVSILFGNLNLSKTVSAWKVVPSFTDFIS